MAPNNYSRQVVASLKDGMRRLVGMEKSMERTRDLALEILPDAVKFVLPINGALLEDHSFRGLDLDVQPRLPFPSVALEFSCTDGSKMVVFARENEPDFSITFGLISQWKGGVGWQPILIGDVGPSEWAGAVRTSKGLELSYRIRNLPEDLVAKRAVDLGAHDSLLTLLSLLNALSCSNVGMRTIAARRPNRAAARRGALPFDDYKILQIGCSGGERDSADRAGRFVREHLRRGHIRRYESGKRIWINSMIVAAGAGAVVHKDYVVRA